MDKLCFFPIAAEERWKIDYLKHLIVHKMIETA